jgi:hypothetical protein
MQGTVSDMVLRSIIDIYTINSTPISLHPATAQRCRLTV